VADIAEDAVAAIMAAMAKDLADRGNHHNNNRRRSRRRAATTWLREAASPAADSARNQTTQREIVGSILTIQTISWA